MCKYNLSPSSLPLHCIIKENKNAFLPDATLPVYYRKKEKRKGFTTLAKEKRRACDLKQNKTSQESTGSFQAAGKPPAQKHNPGLGSLDFVSAIVYFHGYSV